MEEACMSQDHGRNVNVAVLQNGEFKSVILVYPYVAMPGLSANVEGLTASNGCIISVMCMEQHCHYLCLQEIHKSKDQASLGIPGIAPEPPHNRHGSTVFFIVNDGLNISVCEEENVELITSKLPCVAVHPMCNHHLNHSDSLH